MTMSLVRKTEVNSRSPHGKRVLRLPRGINQFRISIVSFLCWTEDGSAALISAENCNMLSTVGLEMVL